VIKLSDWVMDFIAGLGVRHVFMLAGGGAMHLVDSLGRNKKLKYICNLHEQACAIAADAYSQYTNNLGVALVTTGPGGTNTITGVAGAWLDSTPVLFISGQVKRADMAGNSGLRQLGFQEINIVKLVSSITKYAVTVIEPDEIRYHMEKAIWLAKNGRPGPVWIDIPLDVQASNIDETKLRRFTPNKREGIKVPDKGLFSKVNHAIKLLNQAQKPVILAGNGIRLSGILQEFLNLIEKLNIPILTTWKAADFLPENHPLYVGRPGAVGQRGANFTQQNADWILIIGARLDLGQTAYSYENFARNAKKIIVDIDPAELSKLKMKISLTICADAGDFIQEFKNQKDKIIHKKESDWLAACKLRHQKYPVVLPQYYSPKNVVNDYVLIDVLSELMNNKDLLIPGSSGACSERTLQAVRVKKGMRILNTQGLGSMGFGIPAAIGGCLAGGRKRTICIDGDGGFIMNIQDLETVKRLNLPIKYFVLSNQGYGSIIATQRNHFKNHFVGSSKESGLTLPDIIRVAKSYQIPSMQIKNQQNIKEKVNAILKIEGPVVCEVLTSSEQVTMPRVSSKILSDGSIVSMPMENLWPYLEEEKIL
jgi:acetolactate synthase I/II/III large subunit